MSTNLWKQLKQNRDHDIPFELTTADGELVTGKFIDPEKSRKGLGHELVAEGVGGRLYRWDFHRPLSKVTINIILKGLKSDPEFGKQFLKPDNLVLIDRVTLADTVQAALGAHQILESGTAEPTAHSWEQETSVLLDAKQPALFLDFLKKSPLMKLTKTKDGFHLRVTPASGHASEANRLFLAVLSDYTKGDLKPPKAYQFDDLPHLKEGDCCYTLHK